MPTTSRTSKKNQRLRKNLQRKRPNLPRNTSPPKPPKTTRLHQPTICNTAEHGENPRNKHRPHQRRTRTNHPTPPIPFQGLALPTNRPKISRTRNPQVPEKIHPPKQPITRKH